MNGGHGEPLLVLDRVGKGRIAQLLSDQMWLWARGFEGGGPQAELLRRLAYWLMKEPDLEENDLRAAIEGDQLNVTRQSLGTGRPAGHGDRARRHHRSLALSPRRAAAAPARRRSRRWGSTGSPTAPAPRSPPPGRSTRSNSPMCAPPPRRWGRGEGERRRRVLGRRRPDPRGAAGVARPRGLGAQLDGAARERRLCRDRFQRDAAVPGLAALLLAIGLLLAAWRREGR